MDSENVIHLYKIMNFEDGWNQENIIITQTKRSNIVYFPYMCVVAFNPSMWVTSRYTVKTWKNPKKKE